MIARRNIDGLTPKQEGALISLMREPSIDRVAAAAGVTTRTIYNWLDQPHFAAAYRKARRQAFSQAVGLTQRYAALAVQTLAKVMTDDAAPHHAKVSAAATLLKLGRDGIELEDLAARVDELERAAAEEHPLRGAA